VIRAEDLQAMRDQELAGGGPGGAFSQGSPAAPQPNQPVGGSSPWGQPAASDQQGGFQEVPAGGAYSQPPPNQSYNQNFNQSYSSPPPQGSQPSFYGGGGTGTATAGQVSYMDIGDLISGALNVLTSRMADVAPLVVAYAVIYTIGQLFNSLGHGLQIIGALVSLVGLAFIEAGMIYVTQSSATGGSLSFGEILPRITAVLPRLLGAVILAYIAIILGLIGIIIGFFVVFVFLVFVPQEIVLEGAPVFGSLSASWRLVATDFFGILGRVIVAILVLIVAAIVAGILALILGKIPIVGSLVTGIIDGLLIAYFMAYSTLMFLGLKSRTGAPVAATSGF
jgi:hypothetical protein